jgi:hypothetical protein
MILYNPTVSGSLLVTGSLTTTGTITSQTLVVQTITSSIEFVTGSTRNGTLSTNTHEFTGSVLMTGSLSVTTTGTELQVNAGGVNIGNALTDNHVISGSLRINPNGLFVSSSGNVGIGTTAPNSPLNIVKSLGNDCITIGESSGTTRLSIGQESAYTGNYINSGNIDLKLFSVAIAGTGGNIIFNTGNTTTSERMRIQSNGTSIFSTTAPQHADFNSTDANGGYVTFKRNGTSYGYIGNSYHIVIGGSNNDIALAGLTNIVFSSGTNLNERMRITSGGELLIGTTTPFSSGLLCVQGSSAVYNLLAIKDTYTGPFNDVWYALFTNASSQFVGGIQHTASTTISFVTSSDYRLKEDFKQIKGLETLLKIKTYDFKFKNEDFRMDGVLAHELQEVIPYAVHGVKDGERMQGVDYSKLVPVLIKSVQELKSENDILKEILQRNNIQ